MSDERHTYPIPEQRADDDAPKKAVRMTTAAAARATTMLSESLGAKIESYLARAHTLGKKLTQSYASRQAMIDDMQEIGRLARDAKAMLAAMRVLDDEQLARLRAADKEE